MDEYREEQGVTQQENRHRWEEIQSQVNRPLLMGALALLVILVATAAYAIHQRTMARELAAQSLTSTQAMAQLQTQVNQLNAQLQAMQHAAQAETPASVPADTTAEAAETKTLSEPTPPATEAAAVPAPKPAHAPAVKHHAVKHHPKTDKRYDQLQAQLSEQQKALQSTQQQVEKYRADLEGSIQASHDELSGTIAKNHDELVALEKKGERNYSEFDISKSKQFQRVGPISLSLRKADAKHKSYDLTMIVDDNQLSKKKVDLYEPITLHTESGGQPVQIVVNRVEKNEVHGYVSWAKYKSYELTPATSASATPASTPSPSVGDASAGTQRQQ